MLLIKGSQSLALPGCFHFWQKCMHEIAKAPVHRAGLLLTAYITSTLTAYIVECRET